jgi:hypothetical protein
VSLPVAAVAAALAFLGGGGVSADPRHFFDPRCPPAAVPDPIGSVRWAASRAFKTVTLNASATLADCATLCCGDWSCIAYALDAPASGPLTGTWLNRDSLRGESLLTLAETGDALAATSLDPAHAYWHSASGLVAADGRSLFLVFDGNPDNNRTGNVSADGTSIALSRVSFDPPGFTQVFTMVNQSAPAGPSCIFMDERAPLLPRPAGSAMLTGSRAALPPSTPPPYAPSTFIVASVNATALLGVDGDEFPSTWASDGFTYAGAGDNTQPSTGLPGQHYASPASFFRVSAASPLDPAYPNSAFALQGGPFPLADTDFARAICPAWNGRLANIKSSGVLEVDGTMLWAVSCFNYGDDATFNRQRYGPAWIASSTDAGLNWSSVGAAEGGLFGGRLAAPRFIQAGKGYAGAPDPDFVYALFPGTENNASFFECNDAAWLGRAPRANDAAAPLQLKSSWEFFVGTDSDGGALWDSDDTIAAAVLDWPLHTSVQQVNWHPSLQRYILGNWVWVSMDGYPRPDHSPDDKHDRTSRQRTWLTLLEAERPWGPWRVFYSDNNWAYDDGSTGAYTPTFPAQWVNETDDSFWMVSTQCCGDPEFPPTNHYSFNAQRVSVRRI